MSESPQTDSSFVTEVMLIANYDPINDEYSREPEVNYFMRALIMQWMPMIRFTRLKTE